MRGKMLLDARAFDRGVSILLILLAKYGWRLVRNL